MVVKFIIKIIYKLIEFIERIEYRNLDLDESDTSKKIINSISLSNCEVLSDTGFVSASEIHLTQPYQIYQIRTQGHYLKCADNHIVFDESFNQIFVKDLYINQRIQTDSGLESVIEISKFSNRVSMFDISIDDKNHRYFTNGILSHNTIMSAFYIMWYMSFNWDRNVLIVANKGRTMHEIIEKIKTVYANLPFFLKPGILVNNVESMSFDNGSRIIGQATSSTPALGFTIHLLYADEFAHIPKNIVEPFYRSVYPTLSSSAISRMIITSTPNGMNKFYDIYNGAIRGENEFNPIRVDWWEVPGRDDDWRRQEIANLGSIEAFNQEYGNQFINSENLLIDYYTLCRNNRMRRSFIYQDLWPFQSSGLNYDKLKWTPGYDPLDYDKKKDRFVISVDIADGIGKDYSVINIFKIQPFSIARIKTLKKYTDVSNFFRLVQVGLFHTNNVSIDDFSKILSHIIFELYDPEIVKVILEVNFKGDLLIDKLSKHKEFFIEMFLHTKHNQSNEYLSPGIKLNRHNKPLMCNEFSFLLRESKILITDALTIEETTSFGLDPKGNYQSQSGNDDLVMTCINLVPYFESLDYYDTIEEIMESYGKDFINIINNKMKSLSDDDRSEFDYGFLKKLFNS